MRVRELVWVDDPISETMCAEAVADSQYEITYYPTRRQYDEDHNIVDVTCTVTAWLHFNGEYSADSTNSLQDEYDSVEEAKLACQEHFNKMILSQLSEHMDV